MVQVYLQCNSTMFTLQTKVVKMGQLSALKSQPSRRDHSVTLRELPQVHMLYSSSSISVNIVRSQEGKMPIDPCDAIMGIKRMVKPLIIEGFTTVMSLQTTLNGHYFTWLLN